MSTVTAESSSADANKAVRVSTKYATSPGAIRGGIAYVKTPRAVSRPSGAVTT